MKLNERQLRSIVRRLISETINGKSVKEQVLKRPSPSKLSPEDYQDQFRKYQDQVNADVTRHDHAAWKAKDANKFADSQSRRMSDEDLYNTPSLFDDEEHGEDFVGDKDHYDNPEMYRRNLSLDDLDWKEEDWDAEEDEYYTDQVTGKILESDDSKEESGYILMKSSRSPGGDVVKKSDAYKGKVYKTRKEASAAAKELKKDNSVGFDIYKIGQKS